MGDQFGGQMMVSQPDMPDSCFPTLRGMSLLANLSSLQNYKVISHSIIERSCSDSFPGVEAASYEVLTS